MGELEVSEECKMTAAEEQRLLRERERVAKEYEASLARRRLAPDVDRV